MLKLDNNLLDELGLGSLPEDQKRSMLQHIYDTLELRVGTNLANQMTDQQLEEFEKFIDDGGDANQAQALQWLETNLPNYKQVVNEVFEALKAEIKQMAPQIVASSAAAAQQAAQVPPSAPPMSGQPMAPPAVPTARQPAVPPQPQMQQPPLQPQQAPAGYQQPQMPPMQPQPPVVPAGPGPQQQLPAQDDWQQGAPNQPGAQGYPFPQQQPPAGPGGYQQQPPQYPGGQQAA